MLTAWLSGKQLLYRHHTSYDDTFELDIFLLQACALLLGPDKFIDICQRRFMIPVIRPQISPTQWHIIFREWLMFLLTVAKERTKCGMSTQALLRREIIQRLATTDLSYSQLSSQICRRLATHPEFETTLNQVATYQSATETRSGVYQLRPSCWDEFDLYFPLYTSRDQQLALERYQDAKKTKATPPPRYYDSYGEFAALDGLLYCPTMCDILCRIFGEALLQRSGAPSADVSEGALSIALHILAMATARAPRTPIADTTRPILVSETPKRTPKSCLRRSGDGDNANAADDDDADLASFHSRHRAEQEQDAADKSDDDDDDDDGEKEDDDYEQEEDDDDEQLVRARRMAAKLSFDEYLRTPLNSSGRMELPFLSILLLLYRSMKNDGDNAIELLKTVLLAISDRDPTNSSAIRSALPELITEQEQQRKAAEDAAKARKDLLRRRQQEILARFKNQQQTFLESSGELSESTSGREHDARSSSDEALHNVREFECALCHVSTDPSAPNAKIIGHISLVQRNRIVALSSEYDQPPEHAGNAPQRRPHPSRVDLLLTNVAAATQEQAQTLDRQEDDDDMHTEPTPWHNINRGDSVDIKFCGHHIHLSCLYGYFTSLCETYETVLL